MGEHEYPEHVVAAHRDAWPHVVAEVERWGTDGLIDPPEGSESADLVFARVLAAVREALSA